jgi:hypothetical protein
MLNAMDNNSLPSNAKLSDRRTVKARDVGKDANETAVGEYTNPG